MCVSKFVTKLLKLSKSSRANFLFAFLGLLSMSYIETKSSSSQSSALAILTNLREQEAKRNSTTFEVSKEDQVKTLLKDKIQIFGPISDNGEQFYYINGEKYKFDGKHFDGPISD